METQDRERSVGVGGVGERHRQPLAAHSMIINDHPTGSKSGPREKQTQSSLSESKCHSGKKYVWGQERGAEMVFVVVGKWWQDAVKSYNVSQGGKVMDVEVIYGQDG